MHKYTKVEMTDNYFTYERTNRNSEKAAMTYVYNAQNCPATVTFAIRCCLGETWLFAKVSLDWEANRTICNTVIEEDILRIVDVEQSTNTRQIAAYVAISSITVCNAFFD